MTQIAAVMQVSGVERVIRTAVVLALIVGVVAAAGTLPPRRTFDIATGPAAASHFSTGELIGRVVSHPPGLARCEKSPLCGPPGVIVSARTSEGAVANVKAVNAGEVASGLAQAPVVSEALAGRGEFRNSGRQTHIRVMAELYAENVLLLVSSRSRIASVADLRRRRVSLGGPQSGTALIAAGILKAYNVRGVRIVRETAEASSALLRDGKIEAFFYLAPSPSPFVADLVNRGLVRLVPIDGKGRARLAAKQLSAATIAAGTYRNTPRLETVAVPVYWIVRDSAPADAVYELLRALYHPGNRPLLAAEAETSGPIRLPDGARLARLPLHPGAARYYREIGLLR